MSLTRALNRMDFHVRFILFNIHAAANPIALNALLLGGTESEQISTSGIDSEPFTNMTALRRHCLAWDILTRHWVIQLINDICVEREQAAGVQASAQFNSTHSFCH
jgi:hypothetical protein